MRPIILAAFISLSSTSAFAVSCTTAGQMCKDWSASQGAEAARLRKACGAEAGRCIARCKGGNKVFIGVSKGNNYPISECN